MPNGALAAPFVTSRRQERPLRPSREYIQLKDVCSASTAVSKEDFY